MLPFGTAPSSRPATCRRPSSPRRRCSPRPASVRNELVSSAGAAGGHRSADRPGHPAGPRRGGQCAPCPVPRARSGTALILIDVDHFKAINDTYGHPGGDEVLVQLADVLVGCSRSTDVVSRLGGDEIALLLPGCSGRRARRPGRSRSSARSAASISSSATAGTSRSSSAADSPTRRPMRWTCERCSRRRQGPLPRKGTGPQPDPCGQRGRPSRRRRHARHRRVDASNWPIRRRLDDRPGRHRTGRQAAVGSRRSTGAGTHVRRSQPHP